MCACGLPAVYRLYTVVPRLVKFIDQLTNWYVRFNRKRLKGEVGGREQCQQALQTLFSVLFIMTRMMAPFTPFLTEYFYQNLRHVLPWKQDEYNASVHYLMLPKPRLGGGREEGRVMRVVSCSPDCHEELLIPSMKSTHHDRADSNFNPLWILQAGNWLP